MNLQKLILSYGWEARGYVGADIYYEHVLKSKVLVLEGHQGIKNLYQIYINKYGWDDLFEDDKIFEGEVKTERDFKDLMRLMSFEKTHVVNNSTKFKFINFSHPIELLMIEDDPWEEVPCPLPYSNLPDGEYLIRGNKKGQRKEYWRVEGHWFLTQEVEKDNGHYMCDATEYALYPQKPESFWKKLSEVPWNCLSKYWQRALYGYQFHMELRESSRNMSKQWMHFFDDDSELKE